MELKTLQAEHYDREVYMDYSTVTEMHHAQDPDYGEVLPAREEKAEVGREDRKEIDDPEERERVGPYISYAPYPYQVLDGEEDGEGPLDSPELGPEAGAEVGDRVEHDGADAQEDQHHEGRVETPTPAGLVAEDHLIRLASERVR